MNFDIEARRRLAELKHLEWEGWKLSAEAAEEYRNLLDLEDEYEMEEDEYFDESAKW